ncbi:MAG TPA: (2Fe-2S)-binding protein [Burkholderiaceae bacterium]|nr:(2Fe-2S)-binding protein [Burkholderiaceae bacterium]
MTASISILINGEPVSAEPGVSLGSVIHARHKSFRTSPKLSWPRGIYCGMGVCFECVITVDGKPARACVTPVRNGMSVEVHS